MTVPDHVCDQEHSGYCAVCCLYFGQNCPGCELPDTTAGVTPALTPPGGIARIQTVAVWVEPDQVTAYVPGVGVRVAAPNAVGLVDRDGALTDVLNWVDDISPGQVSVILSRAFAVAAGLGDRPAVSTLNADHPALAGAERSQWSWGAIHEWITFYRGTRVVCVGIEPWIGEHRYPLAGYVTPLQAVTRLGAWHAATGTVYRSTPGVTATAMIRDHYRNARKEPTWLPESSRGIRTHVGNSELDWLPVFWQRAEQTRWEHGYDARMMYLGAAGSAELPWWTLRQNRDATPPKGETGYHLIVPSPWTLNTRMPSPVGPRTNGQEMKWVTTPTLRLLDELHELGVYGGYDLIESWTSQSGRVLRPWAEKIRDAVATAHRNTDDLATYQELKQAYRECVGLMGREGGRVYRPEWRHIIIAVSRANIWRKVWAVGQDTGRWPLRIDTDCVWYGSDSADPITNAPLPLGLGLGKFSVKSTIEHAAVTR